MYLVINLGLKSIRGIIFNELEEVVYSKALPVHTTLFKNKVEQDATEWIKLLETILTEIKVNTNLSSKIQYITTTTSSSCILGLDENFRPVTKVLMVSDKRAVQEVVDIKSSVHYRPDYNVKLSSLLPKVLWVKRNENQTYNKVNFWVGANEFLSAYFTKKIFTDSLNAGKASYCNSSYPTTLIKEIGLDIESLPEVISVGSKVPISSDITSTFGLSDKCTLILSTYDAICAVLGSNNGSFDNACDVSGTVTSVRALSKEEFFSNRNTLLVQEIDYFHTFIIGSSNNLGGGIIEWLKQSFYAGEEDNPYYKMERHANDSAVGANGLVFLPYMLGERSPFYAPTASGNYFGIKRSTTLKDFTRASFESTAFVTRDLLDLITESGKNINSLSVSGGLARFDLINQIKADVCNLPVHVIANFESTSIGALIILLVAIRKYSSLDEALENVVKIRKTIYPSVKNNLIYNGYFDLFKRINESLKPIYDEHQKVIELKEIYENEVVSNL